MADAPITITLNLDGMRRFRRVLSNRSGEIDKAFKAWTKIYASFISKRFTKYSRGGGNWKKLKPETIRAKQRKGYTRPKRILYATGKMRRNLSIAVIGNVGVRTRKTRQGIRVSYGNNSAYPSGVTVRRVMYFHQKGGGNLPKRKIIVPPNMATKKRMADRMTKAVKKEADKNVK